jgi:hypothetical protein
LGFFIDAAERPCYAAVGLDGEPVSGGYGSDAPERAFDGCDESFWVSSQRGTSVKGEAWIGYAFADPQAIRRIRIAQTSNPPFRQDVVRVEKSTDGESSWIAAAPGPFRIDGATSWIDLPSGDPARRWRIIAAGDNASDLEHAWSVYEISFFQAVGSDAGTGACVAPRL